MPWTRNLGGARVQLELAEEFQALGHQVEKFDYYDAFPQAKSSRLAELTRPSFAVKAKAFVRANAHRFDIIDAHQGNLPFSKQELGFHGLLVARSVGLYAFYEEFAKYEKTKWLLRKKGNPIANWLRSRRHRQEKPYYLRSLQTCDLINVPNQDELSYVRDVLGLGNKCIVSPFGLSQQRQQSFAKVDRSATVRLANKQIAFIGSWGPRKGSRDWTEIVKRIKADVPGASFLFLGTGFSADKVLEDLGLSACDWVKVIPHYDNEELPELLNGATVGAFPSYIEGFPFAVLEKLASGLPIIAYDVPGPREMLRHFDNSYIVSAGDVESFSSKLVSLLKLDEVSYSQLSRHCVEVAQMFSWHKIAQEQLNIYYKSLEAYKLSHNYG